MDKALINSELYKLPPMRFSVSENRTTVTLFSYRPLSEINKQERLAACYQHACLMFEDNIAINNQSVRERFGLNKNQSSAASRILADTIEEKLIKPSDEESVSKKFSTYVPFYA